MLETTGVLRNYGGSSPKTFLGIVDLETIGKVMKESRQLTFSTLCKAPHDAKSLNHRDVEAIEIIRHVEAGLTPSCYLPSHATPPAKKRALFNGTGFSRD